MVKKKFKWFKSLKILITVTIKIFINRETSILQMHGLL